MSVHGCEAFQGRLVALVRTGQELAPGEIKEARGCSACSALVGSLEEALRPLGLVEPTEATLHRAQQGGAEVLARVVRGLRALRLLSPLALVAVARLWMEVGSVGRSRVSAWSAADWLCILVPLVWALSASGFARERGVRPPRLYTRWDGQQIQGVCAGLGIYWGLPAWLFRIAFVAMVAVGLPGVSLYLLLSLGLSFAPEDRRHFLLFRCQRGLRRLRRGDSEAA